MGTSLEKLPNRKSSLASARLETSQRCRLHRQLILSAILLDRVTKLRFLRMLCLPRSLILAKFVITEFEIG